MIDIEICLKCVCVSFLYSSFVVQFVCLCIIYSFSRWCCFRCRCGLHCFFFEVSDLQHLNGFIVQTEWTVQATSVSKPNNLRNKSNWYIYSMQDSVIFSILTWTKATAMATAANMSDLELSRSNTFCLQPSCEASFTVQTASTGNSRQHDFGNAVILRVW